MTDQGQHEVLLDTINKIQEDLDSIFISIDEGNVGELKVGLALISLKGAKLSIEQAKDDVTT